MIGSQPFLAEMRFGLLEFLMLAGSLGLFIYGMKLMSEGLQKVAGGRMRNVLETMTGNRLRGVLTGFTTTTIVQYSSVTTVMVVSFVNAGLLTLRQAIPVVMGANIGTTVKLLLFAFIGFSSVRLSTVAVPLLGLALPLLFMRGGKLKAVSELMVGAALLFLGLDLLKANVPVPSAQALSFLHELSAFGIGSDLLFVLFGAALAIITQSSSVALVLTVVLCEKGIIGYEMAAALVIGENIGTTLTANIAALVGNAWAKRAARSHFVFNSIGAVWALILLKPYLLGIASVTERINHVSPWTDSAALKWSLTYLHFSFNLFTTLLLIWFIPALEKLVTRMVPARGAPDEEYRLEYIGDPTMSLTPELTLVEAKKEIVKFGELCHCMLGMVRDLLIEKDNIERVSLLQRIAKYEDITDRVEVEISDFLTRTSAEVRDAAMSERIRGMLSIIGDLERVGDILFQMSKSMERKNDDRLWFSPEQRQHLLSMLALIDKAFEVMLKNLGAERDNVNLDEAMEFEQRINQQRDLLRRAHLINVESGDHNIKSGLIYSDLFNSCEKLGDHLINVSEALMGMV